MLYFNLRFFDSVRYALPRKQERHKILPDDSESTSTAIEQLQMNVDLSTIQRTDKCHITWIGHATSYYQTDGVFFLTDPVWSKRVSPFQFVGPSRLFIFFYTFLALLFNLLLTRKLYRTSCCIGRFTY